MKNCVIILFLLITIFLTGCGSSIQTIDLNLQCDGNCNNGNAVVIKIYQLKSTEKFNHASFESLLKNPNEILTDDLIPNTKFEKTLVPGEKFSLNELEINKDTFYLGIMGDFYSPAKDGWQQIVSVNDLESLKIKVHENSISVEKNN
jgi:type VI secretion system VasD/TssJ family lipoprotein